MTEITWNELTADEREALLRIANGHNIDASLWSDLNALDLVGVKYGTGLSNVDYLTDAGRAVLAQKPTAKTVKLRVPSADGLYYEVLYTDGTWEGEEPDHR